jgi:hypothetical protein
MLGSAALRQPQERFRRKRSNPKGRFELGAIYHITFRANCNCRLSAAVEPIDPK